MAWPEPPFWRFRVFLWVDGLVVAGGVDGEFADDLAGLGVDDGDVVVLDEHGDAGSLGGLNRPGFGSDPVEGELEHAQEVQPRVA